MRLPIAIASLISVSVAAPVFADEPVAAPVLAPPAAMPPAAVQPTAMAPAAVPATAVPAFALMDVNGERSRVDVDLALGLPVGGGSGVLYTTRLRGELMSRYGLGGYGSFVAGGYSSGSGSDSDSGSGLTPGNVELGVVYHAAINRTVDLGLHGGVTIHTAGDDNLATAVALLTNRPSDLLMVARGSAFRFGVSPQIRDGAVFARVDLGLDHPLDVSGTLLHFNAGLGLSGGNVSAAAELQAVFATEGDDSFVVGGVSLHYNGTHAAPYVALTTPINNDLVGDVVTVTAGISILL